MMLVMTLPMKMNIEKLEALEDYLKSFDRDCYKPIRTDDGFGRRRNNYIEYTSTGDRYENLSPEEYLDIIRPYSRDFKNDHKPTVELNNDSDAKRRE